VATPGPTWSTIPATIVTEDRRKSSPSSEPKEPVVDVKVGATDTAAPTRIRISPALGSGLGQVEDDLDATALAFVLQIPDHRKRRVNVEVDC